VESARQIPLPETATTNIEMSSAGWIFMVLAFYFLIRCETLRRWRGSADWYWARQQ